MPYVPVGRGEPLEKVLKRFRRKIEQEGIIRQAKERKYYEKPSQAKRRKQKLSRSNSNRTFF